MDVTRDGACDSRPAGPGRSRRLALAVPLVAASTADVSGTWDVEGSVYGNPVKYPMVLKQDGEKLTGTPTLEGKDVPVTGAVREKQVTWKFTVEYQGSQYENEFTGTLTSETEMKGTIAVAGLSGEFSARRR